ncbi:mannonate dehydratase [Gracilimonas mengyeensis]|uniref:Mannonate dehydratase n=1 Tax=Gracilimonas mengyeensis TaxID=1302730 RepID=A0A521FDM8_9BACT|nr:mannonate dehydratase [Gracilimonas mengyeensis]SMO94277.1 D-mannonate dehydratase [Gracilimonas mengyeensis]
MKFEYTWRWYGPDDPISLKYIRQTEATGIVTALHHIPVGKVWSVDEIQNRKKEIEAAGLRWSVVESVPVHEDIKKRKGQYLEYIENYQQTIRNLALCEIDTICYNFMPILDWTRTNLQYQVENGSFALRFEANAFAAFDLFILRRKGAEEDYSDAEIQRAELYYNSMNRTARDKLTDTIIAGLPGGHEGYSIEEFKEMLDTYKHISASHLEKNLKYFLSKVIPVAEEQRVKMCIHPDDPPYPILGLPRVVSTAKDIKRLLKDVDSKVNGITFCTGSYGVLKENKLPKMAAEFADRIHFLHLRSVQREQDGSFYEADHLKGDSQIAAVMHAIINSDKLDNNHVIPVRPDHGHKMLDDIGKETNPGYSCIGRMKGLSELRGLEQGLRFNLT